MSFGPRHFYNPETRKKISFYKSKSIASSSKRGGNGLGFKRRRTNNGQRRVVYHKEKITGAVNKPELKFFDVSIGKVLTTTLANVLNAPVVLNSMVQGDNQSERIGNKIIVKSIQCKGYFLGVGAASGTANSHDNLARVLVFVDHQCNGILPLGDDIVETSGAYNTPYNVDHSDQFTVLYSGGRYVSQKVVWDTVASGFDGFDAHVPFSFYKRMNMAVKYNGTTADIASVVTNSINVFGMIENTLCAVTLFATFRIRYTG